MTGVGTSPGCGRLPGDQARRQDGGKGVVIHTQVDHGIVRYEYHHNIFDDQLMCSSKIQD